MSCDTLSCTASYSDVSLLKKSVGARGKKGTRSSPVARASRSSRETPEDEAGHEHRARSFGTLPE